MRALTPDNLPQADASSDELRPRPRKSPKAWKNQSGAQAGDCAIKSVASGQQALLSPHGAPNISLGSKEAGAEFS